MIDDTMQLGYQKLARKDVAGACQAWLSYWKAAVKLMEKWKIKTLSRFDEQFLQTQSLFNWCQDFDPLVDPEERLLRENMRRAMAESCFDMGEASKADRLYEDWLAADPGWGWGWIGWSDLYWLFSQRERDYQRAEQILTRAIGIPELRDRNYVLERLSDLHEESGQTEDNITPFVAERRKKIGRNDPCPCGSGKKYKRCCGG